MSELSDPQWQAMVDTMQHGDPSRRVRGRSQHGGWSSVMFALEHKNKWIRPYTKPPVWRLTAAGKRAFEAEAARRGWRPDDGAAS